MTSRSFLRLKVQRRSEATCASRMSVRFLSARSYDGATLVSEAGVYDMGNFLGSGAAGTVYEAQERSSQECVAIKIVNPIGYKLASSQLIQRCQLLHKVREIVHRSLLSVRHHRPSRQGLPLSPDVAAGRAPFTAEHVCWLYDANARQLVTAFSGESHPRVRLLCAWLHARLLCRSSSGWRAA